jgi:hypothetical protein
MIALLRLMGAGIEQPTERSYRGPTATLTCYAGQYSERFCLTWSLLSTGRRGQGNVEIT